MYHECKIEGFDDFFMKGLVEVDGCFEELEEKYLVDNNQQQCWNSYYYIQHRHNTTEYHQNPKYRHNYRVSLLYRVNVAWVQINIIHLVLLCSLSRPASLVHTFPETFKHRSHEELHKRVTNVEYHCQHDYRTNA